MEEEETIANDKKIIETIKMKEQIIIIGIEMIIKIIEKEIIETIENIDIKEKELEITEILIEIMTELKIEIKITIVSIINRL